MVSQGNNAPRVVLCCAAALILSTCNGPILTPLPVTLTPTDKPKPTSTQPIVEDTFLSEASSEGDCSLMDRGLDETTLSSWRDQEWVLEVSVQEDELERQKVYWGNRIILSGEKAAVEEVAKDGAIGLSEIDGIDFTLGSLAGKTMRLYSFGDGSITEILSKIYQKVIAENLSVFAEPDYVISPRYHGSFGSPSGGPPHAGADRFLTQWAFDKIGISGLDPSEGLSKGSPIAVFDTSPFQSQGRWRLTRGDQSLEVCALHIQTPFLIAGIHDRSAEDGIYSTGVESTIEHGLFAAGLANAVSPSSPISLITVLDDAAYGDLYSLIVALELYGSEAPASVINLSLGVHTDDPDLDNFFSKHQFDVAAGPSTAGEFIESRHEEVLGYAPPSYPDEYAPIPIFWSMMKALSETHVIVAASGNDSGGLTEPLPAHLPAFWDEVISVGASRLDGERACFSNEAEVYAPGGDGMSGTTTAGQSFVCQPAQMHCTDVSCEYGVISTVTTLRSATGYAYWSGTSFAAPLVSGLAALLWQCDPSLSPQQVQTSIASGRTGQGIIDVSGTYDSMTCLAATPTPTPTPTP